MMRSAVLKLSVTLILGLTLAACGGASPADVLPTSTPLPPAAEQPMTPTPLPPATVTPYPTATPGGEDVSLPDEGPGDGGDEAGADDPAGGDEAQPEATAVPAPAGGGVADLDLGSPIYQTDFAANWPSISEDTAQIQIDRGQYLFEVGPFDGRFIWTTAVDQPDLFASIEATPSECPPRGGYGLAFRFKDLDNYYLFTVFCDNTYTVVARINGALSGVGLEASALPGGLDAGSVSTHTVGVLTSGSDFSLYLDGQLVTTFSDARLDSGDIAWYAVSQSDTQASIRFDNLEVRAIR